MAYEIERKFLVTDMTFKVMAVSETRIVQAYLSADPDCTVRVRVCGDRGYITVKSRNVGAVRHEWEYEIGATDAVAMSSIASGGRIEKTRYVVPYAGHDWEIDVFHGTLEGLVLAEIELASAGESVDLPPFVGDEVTDDPQYYNSSLAQRR